MSDERETPRKPTPAEQQELTQLREKLEAKNVLRPHEDQHAKKDDK